MIKTLLLLLFIILIISCSIPENLGLPTWSTKYQLYVLNDVYDAAQLAENDSSLVAYGDTLGFFETMNETSTLDFTTDVIQDNDTIDIGDLEIDNPNPTYTSIPLSEVAPGLTSGYIPAPGILPFTMPDILKDDLAPFDQFQEMHLISGMMQFSLTNNTVIWFGNIGNGEPLVINILDSDDNVILSHEFSEDIPPDNTVTIVEYESLAGVTLLNQIKVLTTGGSRGSDGEAVDVNVDATLDIGVSVVDLVAQYAIAQIPEQVEGDTLYVTLDEDVTIYQSTLSYEDNSITIDIANDIDLDIVATLHIADLYLASNSDSFTHEILIPASGGFGQTSYVTENIDINGATLGDGSLPLDSLKVVIDVVTLDSGDEYREISSADVFDIQTTIDSLEFNYVQGLLQPKEQDPITGSSVLGISYPFITGEFAVTGYSEITFNISTPVPAILDVELNAINSDQETVQLVNYNTNEIPQLIIGQGNTTIVLNSDDYNINEFISILPDSIWYTIYPTVGDSTTIFEFFEGDMINAEINIESQLDIAANCWAIPQDEDGNPQMDKIDTADIGQTEIDAFISAKLTLNYNNTLGFDTSAKILFSPEKTEDFTELINPDTTQFTIIDVPYIHQSTGPGLEQVVEIELKHSDLEFFLGDSVFVVPKIQLISEEGFPLSGSIQLQGLMEIEVEFSSGLTD
ncbi:MAG: hypothetical protein Q7J16_01870 [Candidatus Cloacimonadales bacterium]|nr:hypothetical protein [Candidatus Cloacimonadales bacterium]